MCHKHDAFHEITQRLACWNGGPAVVNERGAVHYQILFWMHSLLTSNTPLLIHTHTHTHRLRNQNNNFSLIAFLLPDTSRSITPEWSVACILSVAPINFRVHLLHNDVPPTELLKVRTCVKGAWSSVKRHMFKSEQISRGNGPLVKHTKSFRDRFAKKFVSHSYPTTPKFWGPVRPVLTVPKPWTITNVCKEYLNIIRKNRFAIGILNRHREFLLPDVDMV
jgi:hypothetical protein